MLVSQLRRETRMTDNLFVSTTCFKDMTPLSDVLEKFKGSSFKNLELGSNHIHEKNYVEMLKRYDYRYLVHNYFPIPENEFVLNLATINDEIRSRSIEHGLKAIELTHEIGGELYTIHPGFLADPISKNQDSNNYDFVFGDTSNAQSLYEASYERMLDALEKLSRRASELKVKLAIETEGSFNKSDILMMQRPEEYTRFFNHFKPEEIRINLNVGHLNLASRKFGFSQEDFCKLVSPYVEAVEMSHNEGVNDDHAPVREDGWYWELLKKTDLNGKIQIFEFRDTEILEIEKCKEIFNRRTRVN